MKSKSITLIGDDIKLDGPTTITKTLHVIGKTTIDPDAVIANKSFIGHIHGNGNMGSPTTPPV
jgi:phage baseplate assembly protein gpV